MGLNVKIEGIDGGIDTGVVAMSLMIIVIMMIVKKAMLRKR